MSVSLNSIKLIILFVILLFLYEEIIMFGFIDKNPDAVTEYYEILI